MRVHQFPHGFKMPGFTQFFGKDNKFARENIVKFIS